VVGVAFLGVVLSATETGRPPAGTATDSTAIDPCAVAPVEQLKFVLTAGLGRLFPLHWNQGQQAVTLTEPAVDGTVCPSLHSDVGVRVSGDPSPERPGAALDGSARIGLAFSGQASFTRTPRTSGTLKEASLCVRQVERVQLAVKDAPAWLTGSWMQIHLTEALVQQRCFDITSLVYVFLQRGGTLGAAP
jgi:hypothetical protein